MECPDAETLAALAGEQLTPGERAAIAHHAAGCSSCRDAIAGVLESATAGVATVPEAPASVGALAPGTRIDRYVVDERIGAGGMGVVYAARDLELGRRVAVKLVRASHHDERLRREAQALARLSHPNVVAIYDVGTYAGQTFLAMALVDGVDLRQWLTTPRRTEDIVVRLVAAGRGLAAAHRAGLIHRDLKPDNIFVAADGDTLIGDFGLARATTAAPASDPGDAPIDGLTATGAVLGTPAYMAPEQAAGDATVASDQFSFCVTAWEALYGARPYQGDTYRALRAAIAAGTITPPPTTTAVTPAIRRALLRGLAIDPGARFPTMDALLAALTAPPRRWPLLASAAAVAGASAIAFAVTRPPAPAAAPCPPSALAGSAWNRARADAMRTALAARTPGAAAAVERVIASLDGYAADWTAMRAQVCTTTEPGRADLLASRLACLDRRALGLGAAVDVVTATTSLAAADAWPFVDDLPPIDRCARVRDVDAPRRSPALDRARFELARIAAHPDDRWPAVREVRTSIEPLGDPALLLEARLLETQLALERFELPAAELSARAALALAERLGDDLGRAQAGALVADALLRSERIAEGQAQLAQAAVALERGGGDWAVALSLDGARASSARATGDLDAEVAARERVLVEAQRHRPADSRAVTDAAVELVDAYQRAQRITDADRVFKLISDVMTAGVDANDALLAEVTRATVASDHALLAGEFATAIAEMRRAVAITGQLFPGSAAYASQRWGLAVDLELAGDARGARDEYQAAATLMATTASPQLGSALEGVARAQLDLGQPAAAIAPARAALDHARRAGNADGVEASTLVLARALVDSGGEVEAVALLTPLARRLDADPDAAPARQADAAFSLSKALWLTGGDRDRDRARALAGDAERDLTVARDRVGSEPLGRVYRVVLDRRLAQVRTWRDRHR